MIYSHLNAALKGSRQALFSRPESWCGTQSAPEENTIYIYIYIYIVQQSDISIRECGSTLYVGMAQGVSFSLYIGIGAKFENTQKIGERRLRTAEYRTVLL